MGNVCRSDKNVKPIGTEQGIAGEMQGYKSRPCRPDKVIRGQRLVGAAGGTHYSLSALTDLDRDRPGLVPAHLSDDRPDPVPGQLARQHGADLIVAGAAAEARSEE